MPGRVYRSEHALRTGDRPPPQSPDEPAGSAAGHSAVMALGSLVSRGTGFLRTVVITAALGSTVVGNAYTTAGWFPLMVYELLLGGILTSVLVPVLVRARKRDPDRGEAYAQRLVTLAVLALAITTVLALAMAPLLVWVSRTEAPGLVTALSYLILPTIFFYGLSGVLTAILNTRGHFAAPMWTPILNNLVVIGTFGLYLLLFGMDPLASDMTPAQVLVAGGGTLLGIAVQAAGLVPALRRVRFRHRWRFDFRALRLRELGRLGGWMVCYVAINQVSVVAVLSLVNSAGAEAGILIYNNVFLLLMMAHGIVGVSIIMALLPRMSAAAADQRFDDLTDDLSRGSRMAAAVLAPVAAAYVVLALPISVTLFQFGAFDAEAAQATAPVLLMAGLALIPFSISQLVMFAFYALPDTKTPALVNVGVVGLRITVQVAVVAASAAFAAAGMMLGNGISYAVAALLLGWLLRRRIGPLGLRRIGGSLAKVVLAAVAAGIAGWAVAWLLPDDGKLAALLQLLGGGLALVVTYLGLAMLLRIREVNEVIGLVRSRLPF
jgi:putative peptidoglycan lipid II flippase